MARTTARNNTTPAKKTTARKTAAKKTTTRKTTQARTTPAKKTPPRLSLVKPTPEQPRLSLVKTPTLSLPTRQQDFLTDAQIYAVHAARTAGLPIHRIRDWTDQRNGTAIRRLRDGSYLHYNHTTRTLTLLARCPMGAPHQYELTTPSSATAARIAVDRCNTPHADLTHLKPLTRDEWEALGVHTGPTWARPDLLDETPTETIPVPLPTTNPEPEPRALADQLAHSDTGTADTQLMSHQKIAAYIAEHTNNTKEHPQP
ncbi:hypothetical protein ACF060_31260 [Streptomyces werraensis]|uniref:hypothetical protein n=1 Tax=Streptomyces werraensis TaxID=68284 RepID=UPI0036FFBA13